MWWLELFLAVAVVAIIAGLLVRGMVRDGML